MMTQAHASPRAPLGPVSRSYSLSVMILAQQHDVIAKQKCSFTGMFETPMLVLEALCFAGLEISRHSSRLLRQGAVPLTAFLILYICQSLDCCNTNELHWDKNSFDT